MKLSTWLTVALVSASVTRTPDASAKAREDFEKVVPFSSGGHFSIKNDNGSITIKTWNENSIRIEAEKTAKNEEYLKDIEINVEGSGDSVSVETVHHRRPRQCQLYDYASRRGQCRRANGQRLRQRQRRSRPSRSKIRQWQLEARGHRRTRPKRRTAASARYTQATKGRHSFHTTNGSVRIYLPAGAGGELDAQTVNGSITTDFPTTVTRVSRRHLKGSFGSLLRDRDGERLGQDSRELVIARGWQGGHVTHVAAHARFCRSVEMLSRGFHVTHRFEIKTFFNIQIGVENPELPSARGAFNSIRPRIEASETGKRAAPPTPSLRAERISGLKDIQS